MEKKVISKRLYVLEIDFEFEEQELDLKNYILNNLKDNDWDDILEFEEPSFNILKVIYKDSDINGFVDISKTIDKEINEVKKQYDNNRNNNNC